MMGKIPTPAFDEPLVDESSASVEHFVRRFNAAWKRGAEAILDVTTTLVEAEDQLSEKRLDQFYSEIGMDRKGSTCKKLRKIGEVRSRFKDVEDRLPNNWTTIYELARLEADRFDELVGRGILCPGMTRKDIHGLAPPEGDPPERDRKVTIDINKIGLGRRKDFAGRLRQLLREFDVDLPSTQEATLAEFIVPNGTGGDDDAGLFN